MADCTCDSCVLRESDPSLMICYFPAYQACVETSIESNDRLFLMMYAYVVLMSHTAVAVRRAAAFSYYAEALRTTHAKSGTLQAKPASWPQTVAVHCDISDTGSTY